MLNMTSINKLFSLLANKEEPSKASKLSELSEAKEEEKELSKASELSEAKEEEGFEIIGPTQQPKTEKWYLIPLYKNNANGKMTMWQVGFNGKEIIVKFGHLDGIIRRETTEVEVKGNNTLQEQALIEARHRFLICRRNKNYVPVGERPNKFTLMTGNKFYDPEDDKYVKIACWPVATQPKFDGIRAYALKVDGKVRLFSRGNNNFDHITHISEELEPFFDYFPEGTIFDGELYNHQLYAEKGFSSIQSVVKSYKNVKTNLKDIEYYIFDVYTGEEKAYNERYIDLINSFKAYAEEEKECKHIRAVTMSLAYSVEEVNKHLDEYTKIGYEGVMIRQLYYPHWPKAQLNKSIYAMKRCNNILKYKRFYDEEAIVIGLEEAKGTEKGAAILKVRDAKGHEFNIRFKTTIEERRKWTQNPEMVMGREIVFTFQERSEKGEGVPRFPVGKCFREVD